MVGTTGRLRLRCVLLLWPAGCVVRAGVRTTRGRPTMSHRAIPTPFFCVHTGRATSDGQTMAGGENDGGNKGGGFRVAFRGSVEEGLGLWLQVSGGSCGSFRQLC